ncbi:MAG: molybdenum cofactor guanylyltransferase [Nitrospirota bacterium]
MYAIILAGGENRRIQCDKGLLRVNGRRIVETNVELLKKYFSKVFISTNSPELYFYLGCDMIGDILNFRGPMTGIFSAFVCTRAREIFVVACDMPFINAGLVSIITGNYRGQDAVIPFFHGRPQPLPGIYSGRIVNLMEERIRYKRRGMLDLFDDINVHYISEQDIVRVDPEGRSFVNINTMDDLRKIKGGNKCLA